MKEYKLMILYFECLNSCVDCNHGLRIILDKND